MMNYNTRQPGLSGARGTHYNELTDHFFFATDQGQVCLLPTSPATVLSQQGQRLSVNQSVNLNASGGADIRWNGTALTTPLSASPSRLVRLTGFTSLDSIPVSALLNAAWNPGATSLPEDGNSPVGNFYAVKIPYQGDFHYAKVRIFKPAGSATPRVEWVTYNVSPNPIVVGAGYGTDVSDIVVSEYETALYLTADLGAGAFVYYAPRLANSVEAYPAFSPNPQPLHPDPLTNPQQLVLDGGFIFVVDDTLLWRINIDTGEQVAVTGGFSGGTGLLLGVEGAVLKAYISTASGDIFVVDISDFDGATPIALPPRSYQLTGSFGYMSWANREHTDIYIARRDTKEVVRLDLAVNSFAAQGTATPVVAQGTPWSVEVLSDNKLYVSCETEIGEFARSIAVSNNLLLGIGLIPFDYITNSIANPASPDVNDGKADTSSAPGYYFSAHPNLPFGGELSLMVNHEMAWNNGIRYYSIRLRNLATNQSRFITNSFVDQKWEETLAPRFMPVSTSPSGSLYPVRNSADLWYNTHLGSVFRTSFSDNGHNVLTVEFFDANRQPVTNGRFDRLIMIDNTPCRAMLQYPRIGTASTAPLPGDYPSLVCGCLAYETKNDLLQVDFKAWQTQGSGNYTLSVSRGVSELAQSGPVTQTDELLTKSTLAPGRPIRVGHILGDCDVANVVISLSVPSRVINGFGWVNLGSSTYRSFTLIRGPVTHSEWTSPE